MDQKVMIDKWQRVWVHAKKTKQAKEIRRKKTAHQPINQVKSVADVLYV